MTLLFLLIFLLAVPVILLLVPSLAGGLVVHVNTREAQSLITSPVRGAESDEHEQERVERRNALMKRLASFRSKQQSSSQKTLTKKLKYAHWPISPVVVIALECIVSGICFFLVKPYFGIGLQLATLCIGPVFIDGLLQYAIERRFKKFDEDFPQFMVSVVGLLKTGMIPMNAIEVAAHGLDRDSLVQQEVHIMMDKMRVGISEELAIGAFAEDVLHPEIELFIQGLLLSRQVGGALSDTLERLAKQVRKRQYFRGSAVAAVAQQRASTWLIIAILGSLEFYLYKQYPVLLTDCWKDPTGWIVCQIAIVCIMVSIIWSKRVTKIKV